jgi:hypothetical protein
MKGTVVMDLHPDAVLPPAKPTVPSRIDAATREQDAKVAHLRARLLKMIVANEKARKTSEELNRPR